MLSPAVIQQRMAALPVPVLEHLYSEEVGELNARIIDRNALTEDQETVLFDLLREVFVREIVVERLVDEIKGRFGFDESKARKLALDVAGYRLLPLDRWIGDISGYIRRFGGDP